MDTNRILKTQLSADQPNGYSKHSFECTRIGIGLGLHIRCTQSQSEQRLKQGWGRAGVRGRVSGRVASYELTVTASLICGAPSCLSLFFLPFHPSLPFSLVFPHPDTTPFSPRFHRDLLSFD